MTLWEHDVWHPTLDSFSCRARELGEDAMMTARLTRDLPRFLRGTVTRDDARQRLQHWIATRERRVATVVERAIYANPGSPYLRLLRHAGCEVGDFRALLAREGIEQALRTLADRGVYVTFDEFKGRSVAVRGSGRFAFRETDFDNPVLPPHVVRLTGGTTGRPGRVRYSLALVDEWDVATAMVFAAHGVERPRQGYWWPVPVHWALGAARLGHPSFGWFYPVHPLPLNARLAARYLALLGRLGGYRFPLPERCDLEHPEPVVERIVGQLSSGAQVVLWTMTSAATRVAVAARRAGHDLRGATFVLAGEPVTAARRRQIAEAGARSIVQYASTELWALGYSCAAPTTTDDVHAMIDRYAIVQRPRAVFPGGPSVDGLLFTSLNLTASKIGFNTELGDYARVEERECGCLLGELGLTTHLSEIRSFEKLTGEGVTFARGNLERILEEVLPARFGGSSIDYQLVEEEAADSATRLVLRVSPSVGPVDGSAMRTALLMELGRGNLLDRYQSAILESVGTVEIRREPPRATQAGKVLPIQLLRPPSGIARTTRRGANAAPGAGSSTSPSSLADRNS